jgi:hypothetical protein
METTSLKALALKALQGNARGNLMETTSFPNEKPAESEFPCPETPNKKTPRIAVKLYSPLLGGSLWVVQDRERWPNLEGGEVPVYDVQEIQELTEKRVTLEELKAAHEVKKIFKATIQGQEEHMK